MKKKDYILMAFSLIGNTKCPMQQNIEYERCCGYWSRYGGQTESRYTGEGEDQAEKRMSKSEWLDLDELESDLEFC